MRPSPTSKPCTLQLGLTGMNKAINFQFPLRETKHCVGEPRSEFQSPYVLPVIPWALQMFL